jgi:hypothetical protein
MQHRHYIEQQVIGAAAAAAARRAAGDFGVASVRVASVRAASVEAARLKAIARSSMGDQTQSLWGRPWPVAGLLQTSRSLGWHSTFQFLETPPRPKFILSFSFLGDFPASSILYTHTLLSPASLLAEAPSQGPGRPPSVPPAAQLHRRAGGGAPRGRLDARHRRRPELRERRLARGPQMAAEQAAIRAGAGMYGMTSQEARYNRLGRAGV